MRTQEEIVERINKVKTNDYFGFQFGEYLPYLDFENAKHFLKDEYKAKPKDWKKEQLSNKNILQKMEKYMEFAWGKANDCRGISANRSIEHYIAWTWLLNDGFWERVDEEYNQNYQHYGKEILIIICKEYGWDWKKWDDGVRTNG